MNAYKYIRHTYFYRCTQATVIIIAKILRVYNHNEESKEKSKLVSRERLNDAMAVV